MRWVPAVLGVALLTITGCSQHFIDGHARSPDSPVAASYRDGLDSAVRTQLERSDEIRKIDPCSLINLDAATRLGPVKYVGTDDNPDECRIGYDVPTVPGTGISGDQVPGLVSTISVGGRSLDKTETRDRFPHSGSCSIFTSSGWTSPLGEREAVMYSVSISGVLGSDRRDGCDDLQPVVDASKVLVGKPAQRSASPYLPQSKLMTLDPCSPLDQLAVGRKIEITKPWEPFECAYRDRSDSADTILRTIRYAYQNYKDMPHSKQTGPELTKIRDVQTLFLRDGNSGGTTQCKFHSYVDLDDPLSGTDAKSQMPQWVATIIVEGNDTDPQCGSVRAVAEESVHQYQDAK